jgi:hypothetical protein
MATKAQRTRDAADLGYASPAQARRLASVEFALRQQKEAAARANPEVQAQLAAQLARQDAPMKGSTVTIKAPPPGQSSGALATAARQAGGGAATSAQQTTAAIQKRYKDARMKDLGLAQQRQAQAEAGVLGSLGSVGQSLAAEQAKKFTAKMVGGAADMGSKMALGGAAQAAKISPEMLEASQGTLA